MTLLEFEKFDFKLPVRLNSLAKLKRTSVFMKIDTVKNSVTLFLVMQMKFRKSLFLVPTTPNMFES